MSSVDILQMYLQKQKPHSINKMTRVFTLLGYTLLGYIHASQSLEAEVLSGAAAKTRPSLSLPCSARIVCN
jgi:hypothetical protein